MKSPAEEVVNRRMLAGLFEETGAGQGDEDAVKSPVEETVNSSFGTGVNLRQLADLFEDTGASQDQGEPVRSEPVNEVYQEDGDTISPNAEPVGSTDGSDTGNESSKTVLSVLSISFLVMMNLN